LAACGTWTSVAAVRTDPLLASATASAQCFPATAKPIVPQAIYSCRCVATLRDVCREHEDDIDRGSDMRNIKEAHTEAQPHVHTVERPRIRPGPRVLGQLPFNHHARTGSNQAHVSGSHIMCAGAQIQPGALTVMQG
jgi:hypothetical protein